MKTYVLKNEQNEYYWQIYATSGWTTELAFATIFHDDNIFLFNVKEDIEKIYNCKITIQEIIIKEI